MLRLVSPSGTPISLGRVFSAALSASAHDQSHRFVSLLKTRLETKHIILTNTARTGLSLILEAMARKAGPSVNEVIIPAYTCYSVAASIVRAGLKIRPVDVDPETLDFDYSALSKVDLSRVLAIIPSSLFGLLANWSELEKLKQNGLPFLIDDAAQAFGSSWQGHSAGSLGDAGLISLDRGKNLTTYSGGILLTNDDELAENLSRRVEQLPSPPLFSGLIVFVKMILYALLIRPWLYRLPASLPFLGLGETVYDEQFMMTRLGRFQTALGCRVLDNLDSINTERQSRARQLSEIISRSSRYRLPGQADPATIFLRLPVFAQSAEDRDELIIRLRKNGISASRMYPGPIFGITEARKHLCDSSSVELIDYPGTAHVVDHLLTLPTHPYLNSGDIGRIETSLTGEV